MTEIVLVRHGETVWAHENRYAGVTDIPLTDTGRRQAELLATWAADARLDAVYASPLRRALGTAGMSAQRAGLEVRVDPRLRELDFGEGEGLTRGEMAEHFPDALDLFHSDPVAHHLPAGEPPSAAAERFRQALRDVGAAHPGGRVLVVAHTTVIRLTLCLLMGIQLKEYRRVFPFLANCALTEIRLDDDQVSLLQLNSRLEAMTHDGPPTASVTADDEETR